MTSGRTRYRLYDVIVESDTDLSLAVAKQRPAVDESDDRPWRYTEGAVPQAGGRLVHDVLDFDGQRRLQVHFDGDRRVYFSHGDTRALWDGTQCQITLEPGAEMSLRPAIMLERVIAPIALLLLRDRQVALHASAVADVRGRAQIFVGDSGAGKSTTALELMRRGMTILADDLVMLDGERRLLSATPSVRLFDRPRDVPEAIDEQQVRPDIDKYWYQLGNCIDVEHHPQVAAIFSLEPEQQRREPVIEPVRGREATVRVIAQAFDLTEIDADWRTRRFRTLCDLARQVPVYRVRYARGDRQQPDQVRALAHHFGIDDGGGDGR